MRSDIIKEQNVNPRKAGNSRVLECSLPRPSCSGCSISWAGVGQTAASLKEFFLPKTSCTPWLKHDHRGTLWKIYECESHGTPTFVCKKKWPSCWVMLEWRTHMKRRKEHESLLFTSCTNSRANKIGLKTENPPAASTGVNLYARHLDTGFWLVKWDL